MLNLVLYSDQIIPENAAIDRRLIDLLESRRRGNRIGYIPSGPEPDRRYYNTRKAYYARYDLDLPLFFDLDSPHGADDIDALLACDAIHLSGGHTAGFLARLKRSGMLEPLRRWAQDGGVLIGTSAGAILMTPTIATDALFTGHRPEDMQDEAALDLVPFEFFPHFGTKPSYGEDLMRYSVQIKRPIIACHDGDGVVVTGGKVELIGDPLWIADGKTDSVRKLALADIGV